MIMATKRLGLASLTSSTPPNRDSTGMPAFSNTPLATTLQTVARPTLPFGTTTEPSFPPSGAVATSSLTHKPDWNTVPITARALW